MQMCGDLCFIVGEFIFLLIFIISKKKTIRPNNCHLETLTLQGWQFRDDSCFGHWSIKQFSQEIMLVHNQLKHRITNKSLMAKFYVFNQKSAFD